MMDDDGCPQSEHTPNVYFRAADIRILYSDTLNRVRRQAYSVSLSTK